MTTIETVAGFCDRHGACAEGREWALANCASMAEVYDKCERGDWLIWAIRRSGAEIEKAAWVRLAVTFARRALSRFERKHATDKRPRKAIEAAEAWLANPKDETASSAADAADAADAAYAAADAYAYAAYAADAAYAAYAAADAAYAAADAAYAAAAAAYAAYARTKEHKWQADQIRKVIANPWRTP